ncbi:MAG: glycosyltransferase, partial [Gammaproteobacteria bacterium]
MNVLVVSSMFPNRAQPVHAVFVCNRVLRIAERCNIRIINPIRWFPGAWILKKYSHRRYIPRQDSMDGVTVDYPRFLSIPRFLKSLEGLFLFLSLLWLAWRLRATFRFQLIDAHLAYPDGFACALLGRIFNVPLTITLRGHDVNDVPKYPMRRRQVAYALRRATRVIAVAEALRRAAIELGAEAKRSVTIPNGVNAKIFYTLDRDEARQRLNLPRDRKIVVAVGHLVERKGFHLIIEALQH